LEPVATIWPTSLMPTCPADYLAAGIDSEAEARLTEIPQVGQGIGGLGRCRRGWRDGDQTGEIPAED
jgi:hypothetical protein